MQPSKLQYKLVKPEAFTFPPKPANERHLSADQSEGGLAGCPRLLQVSMKTRSRASEISPSCPILEPVAKLPRRSPEKPPGPLDQCNAVTSRPSRAAVSWAVSLLRRRLCGSPKDSDPRLAPLELAQNASSQLKQLLSDTIVHGYNNSALLLGQRGSGKSLVLEDVLRELQSEHPQKFAAVAHQLKPALTCYLIWVLPV